MGNQLLLSEDGFHTLSSDKFGVTYHSIYGALNESITVFLSAGFQYHALKGKSHIKVFEMGLGTGLNALLTMLEADKSKIHVEYTSIDLHPISIQEATKLNYIKELNIPHRGSSFKLIHECNPGDMIEISPFYRFRKFHDDLLSIRIPDGYDVIYYDAFAPTAQEELWDESIMRKMYEILDPGGILVTYCAKGSFKRALKAAGFKVEALPGPPGKREMTRAVK